MSSPSQMSTISHLEALFGLEEDKYPQQYWHAMQQSGAAIKRLSQVGDAAASLTHMRCNAGTEFISDSMVATTMEALLGAAFYNGGLDSVAQMLRVMDLGSGLDAM
ncbi:hypothetical protein ACLOAV_007003 [Pseudogymnoascus australis]